MATLETIKIGAVANDRTGDPLRDAMQKANRNFAALNAALDEVFKPGQLPSGVDLNTYVTSGLFHQSTNAGAAAGQNYPVATAGLLEVFAPSTAFVYQFYTQYRTGNESRSFWRTNYNGVWSAWSESLTNTSGFVFYGGMPSTPAQDLNTYTQRGMWAVGSSAVASSGSNFPIGQSGHLIVYSSGYVGGSPMTTGVVQLYFAANSNRMFFRSLVNGVWSVWDETLRSSTIGAPSGVAGLGVDGKVIRTQLPLMTATVISGGNADDFTDPGDYYINSDAVATATNNWPIQIAGTLNVVRAQEGNLQVTQTYTTRNGTGGAVRTYKRVRFGTSLTWGLWQESARAADTVTMQVLTAASDANTLTSANSVYTWTAGAVVSGGTNWPAIPSGAVGRGHLEVVAYSSTALYQRLVLPQAADSHPLIFERYGVIGGTWYGWRIAGPISVSSQLPTADCGDVYVDGDGWYTWGGSAYARAILAKVLPGTAHDLNNYNIPGDYWQQSGQATTANNYPANGITCFIKVTAFGNAVLQQAFSRSNPQRAWWRVQTGTSASWSAWKEMADMASAMTHVFITTATDANTLTSDNTFYTWTASASLGANFPAFSTNWPAAGYMRVYYGAATQISQELTYLVTGQKPRTFMRFGNSSSGVWQPWKSTSAWHAATGLPTSDMGDIYVDGDGWYRWSGTAYARSDLSYQSISEMNAAIFGRGQAWADVTASRVIGSTYTNTTGRPILVNVTGTLAGADGGFVFTGDGQMLSRPVWSGAFTGGTVGHTELIRPGGTYSLGVSNMNNLKWSEYR